MFVEGQTLIGYENKTLSVCDVQVNGLKAVHLHGHNRSTLAYEVAVFEFTDPESKSDFFSKIAHLRSSTPESYLATSYVPPEADSSLCYGIMLKKQGASYPMHTIIPIVDKFAKAAHDTTAKVIKVRGIIDPPPTTFTAE